MHEHNGGLALASGLTPVWLECQEACQTFKGEDRVEGPASFEQLEVIQPLARHERRRNDLDGDVTSSSV